MYRPLKTLGQQWNIPFGRYCLFKFHFEAAWVHPFSKYQTQPTVAPARERVLVNAARCPAAQGRRAAARNSDESRRDSLQDSCLQIKRTLCGQRPRCARARKRTAITTKQTMHSDVLCISSSCTGWHQSVPVLLPDSCASVTARGPLNSVNLCWDDPV